MLRNKFLNKTELKSLLLFKNHPGTLFSHLPKEVIMKRIGGINAQNALECIIHMDYESLYTILSIDPMVMFMETSATNIDGKIIVTTPLKHAFWIVDTFAFKLCFDICKKNSVAKPDYLHLYFQQAVEVTDCINLQPLFDAYQQYLMQFDAHKNGIISETTLLSDWLAVGKAQRTVLPRHLLRDMCLVPIQLQPVTHDIVLLSCDKGEVIEESKLNEITKEYHHCPVLVNQQSYHYTPTYLFYKFDFLNRIWVSYEITELPISIDFPKQYNQPLFRRVKCNLFNKENFNYSSKHYWHWDKTKTIHYKSDDYSFLLQKVIFAKLDGQFSKLSSLLKDDTLGTKFTLARGAGVVCFALNNPVGYNKLLNHRAKNDWDSLNARLENYKWQKNTFLAEAYAPYKSHISLNIPSETLSIKPSGP